MIRWLCWDRWRVPKSSIWSNTPSLFAKVVLSRDVFVFFSTPSNAKRLLLNSFLKGVDVKNIFQSRCFAREGSTKINNNARTQLSTPPMQNAYLGPKVCVLLIFQPGAIRGRAAPPPPRRAALLLAGSGHATRTLALPITALARRRRGEAAAARRSPG